MNKNNIIKEFEEGLADLHYHELEIRVLIELLNRVIKPQAKEGE